MRTRLMGLCLLLPAPTWATVNARLAGTYLGPGIHIGSGLDAQTGVLLGAEVSLALLTEDHTWLGLYVDALSVGGTDSARLGAGLEAGYFLGGVDGGLIYDAATASYGARGRLLFSLAMESVYLGTAWLPEQGAHWEVGVLLKVPIRVE